MARLQLMLRHHKMLEILNRGPVVPADLAHHFKCHTKTIRRDLEAMIQAGLPVIKDGPYYVAQGESMEKTCKHCGRGGFKTGTGHAAHERACRKGRIDVTNLIPDRPTPTSFRAELFSIYTGAVSIRGCEFNSGFLVLNGDVLQWYPTLAEAIQDAKNNAAHPVLDSFVADQFAGDSDVRVTGL